MTNYITFEEAAQILGVSRESVRLYCRKGLLVQGESHGKKKILKDSLQGLMKYDVVAQDQAVEQYRQELAAQKEEITKMKSQLSAVKEMLKIKSKAFGNFEEICGFLVSFVEETYGPAGLSNRERDIATRLLRGASPHEIAENYDLTRERIRQIWCKALRKIAHSRQLANAVNENEMLKVQVDTLIARNSELMRAMQDKGWNEELSNCVSIPSSLMGIDNEYLGVRACHCLSILGMKHIYQLTFISKRSLSRLRNLGRKTLDNIESFLESYNLKFDDPRSLENVRLPFGETVVEIPWSEINEQMIEVKKLWQK